MMEPTMIKNGIASKGNEDAEEINRCITRLTGIEVLIKRKYPKADAINEKAMGTLSRKRINRRIIGR
ncbi:hypothetical protein A1QK_00075 [Vibrio genomosp. F10 str. 9ZD137]|nr:hypothetical protein A1QK_00075 [Vibrio genomosp. F10 str. 9ZD137]